MERVRVQVDGRTVSLTHLDRVLYPSGFTKAEIVDYYSSIADVLLAHLKDRPLTLVRYPEGVKAGGFFAKNAPSGTPGWVRRSRQATSEDNLDQILADSPATIVWLANLSALELHIPLWKARTTGDTVQRERSECDRMVIDLDPGKGAGIPECATLALALRSALASDGLHAVPKTTGGAGMHLMVPIQPAPVDAVVDYVHELAKALASAAPDLASAKLGEKERVGKVLLDWRQNVYRATTIAPYSLRGRDEPTVATPLTWDEVAEAAGGAHLVFGPDDVRARIQEHGDLAAGVLTGDAPRLPR